jgi:transposase
MLIALPNLDKSFTCTLFLPFEGYKVCFEKIHDGRDAEYIFQTYFNDAYHLMPDLVEEYDRNPTSALINTECYPWTVNNCLLIGDAAHAIVPFYGQGMNAGFEDCRIFTELLEKESSYDLILRKFQEERKSNADAIAELALQNFIEMRDLVADPLFLFRKKVQHLLGNKYPGRFLTRYEMVSFTSIPYKETIRLGQLADQLTDELIGVVVEAVRPDRPSGHGAAWELCVAEHDRIKGWLDDDGLKLTKIHDLLARRGVAVPYRTLHRYAAEQLGFRRQAPTVRVADGEPGVELQVDFGRMGLLFDPATGRRRTVWALIFTAVVSRHSFVWLSWRQSVEDVIDGFEAAWGFFGGVFKVAIPDNLKAIVDQADPLNPRINQTFLEYAQARGFVIDPARVRRPQDKPRVERTVAYVRQSMWAGEDFADLPAGQRHAETWCRIKAGMRIHGTTQARPAELFATLEAPVLLPAPVERYDTPTWTSAKVHRDHHIQSGKALYSVPGDLIGQQVTVRADRKLVKILHRGQVVKIHPRQAPGGRSTDEADLPSEVTAYALRDLDRLIRQAARQGDAVGTYAAALLDVPLPWTRMRTVYRLLGLVKKFGADRVETACARALECEAVDVGLIARMVERAAETDPPAPERTVIAAVGRFARDPSEFAIEREAAR